MRPTWVVARLWQRVVLNAGVFGAARVDGAAIVTAANNAVLVAGSIRSGHWYRHVAQFTCTHVSPHAHGHQEKWTRLATNVDQVRQHALLLVGAIGFVGPNQGLCA